MNKLWFSRIICCRRVFFSENLKNNALRSFCAESPKSKADYKSKGPLNWKRFFKSVAVVGVVFAAGIYYKKQKELEMLRQRRRAIGKAAIGGSFNLIDQNGKEVSSTDFLGKWLLIYFGFTHCPDVCPDEMEKMCAVVDILEKKKKDILPIFISVDPERDTPQIVSSYVKEFSSKLIGLTGTREQINAVTKAYRVYYSSGPKDNTNDYIVDHTIITYLVNPDGEFVDYYGQTKNAEQVAKAVVTNMEKYEMLNKKSWGLGL